MRPLSGVLCAGNGEFVLDGVPRMRERPIIDLVDGLKQVCILWRYEILFYLTLFYYILLHNYYYVFSWELTLLAVTLVALLLLSKPNL